LDVTSPSQDRYIHVTTKTQNKRKKTPMPQAGFEPTIPVFERAKTVHASDCAATVISQHAVAKRKIFAPFRNEAL
jgi:hypothetical protein